MNSKIIKRDTCRVCNKKNLEAILSLGEQYIVNFTEVENQKIAKAPLDLVLCNKSIGGCGLLQLRHTVPGDTLYRKFWYKSGVNKTMRDALRDITSKTEKIVKLKDNDVVVDIGANDGTLLRSYQKKNLVLVGFEPAENLIQDAEIGTSNIINDYFNYGSYVREFSSQKAKIITSIAMFYDLENPNEFVEDVAKILDEDGIWIIQMNYLTTMLENNAFDNIVHEHLEYYSLKSLESLLDNHDLKVFDVELNDINGGSIRTYIKHKKCKTYHITKNVEKIRSYEDKVGVDNPKVYHQFTNRIMKLKDKAYSFIKNQVENGKQVYVYGASTRGNTLLQFYNLNHDLIKTAADRNPTKWGKKIAGTEIPIISEEQARKEKPDFFLVLPWYFIDEFVNREKKFLEEGGKFIVPLPEFRIIDNNLLKTM